MKPRVEVMEARRLLASITEYPIPGGTTSLGNGLFGITGGPDGNVYFTDTLDNAIGQITPSGVITELPLPPSNGGGFFKNGLDGIALGADSELAFTESTQGAIGKITTTGSYTPVSDRYVGHADRPGTRPDHRRRRRDALVDRGWFRRDWRADTGGSLQPVFRPECHERRHHRSEHEGNHRRLRR